MGFKCGIVGLPNVGKSTLFNSLTGLRQHTGNWPGKTVTRAEGGFEFRDVSFKLVDLPGTYSLMTSSEDEEGAGTGLAQVYRHVLLPISFRLIVPPLTSEFLTIFKNSSLALTIGLLELTAQSEAVGADPGVKIEQDLALAQKPSHATVDLGQQTEVDLEEGAW